jgi:hypothetical protein
MISFDRLINQQMEHVAFGDQRLNRRFQKCIHQIDQAGAHNSFPRIFRDPYELKAFYRLMNHPQISHADYLKSYQKGLEAFIEQHKDSASYQCLYLFSDTTFVKYNDRKKLQLGYLETKQDNGLLLHNGVLTDQDWTPLGLAVQQLIVRDRANYGKRHERHKKAFQDKESFKWTEALDWAQGFTQRTGVPIIHVMDREADIAELFNYALQRNQLFVVRARHNRPVQGQQASLWDYVSAQPISSQAPRQLLDRKGKAHLVPCEIRYAEVDFSAIEQPLYAIHLKSNDPDIDLEETQWVLLTNQVVDTPQKAEHLIDVYTHRWRTNEDYHKCLKTGCSIENRQFDSLPALANAIGLLSLVAIRLLRMRHLAQNQAEAPVDQVLEQQEIRLANALAEQHLTPTDRKHCKPQTVLWWVLLLGRLGGHQGVAQKGLPGWQTLFHGWNYFQNLLVGLNLSKNIFNQPDP